MTTKGISMATHDPVVPLTRLHGTWRLVGRRVTHADGKVTNPVGENPRGFIMYSPDGYMAVEFFMSMKGADGKMAERFLAYAGPYELQGDTMLHHLEVSAQPENIGKTYERKVSFENGDLLLSTSPDPQAGPGSRGDMIWRRV
jgi:hypothetical protein